MSRIPVVPGSSVSFGGVEFQVEVSAAARIKKPACRFGPRSSLFVTPESLLDALNNAAYFGDFGVLRQLEDYLLRPEGAAAIHGGSGREQLVDFVARAYALEQEKYSALQDDIHQDDPERPSLFSIASQNGELRGLAGAFARLQRAQTRQLVIRDMPFPERDKNQVDEELNRNTALFIQLLDDSEAKKTQTALQYSVVYIADTLDGTDQALRRAGRMGAEIELPPLSPELRRRWLVCSLFKGELSALVRNCNSLSEYAGVVEGFVDAYMKGLSVEEQIVVDKAVSASSGLTVGDLLSVLGSVGVADFEKLAERFSGIQRQSALQTIELSHHTVFSPAISRAEWKEKVEFLGLGLLTCLTTLQQNLRLSGDPLARRLNLTPQHVLVSGPSGSGKSLLIQLLKNTAPEYAFFMVDSTQIFSQYVGESEQNVIKLFQNARRHAPAVVVLDQIDLITGKKRDDPNHKAESNVSERVLAQILTELDGVVQHSNNIVCIATSQAPPSELDPAIVRPGRLGLHIETPEFLPAQCVREALAWYKEEPELKEEVEQFNPFAGVRSGKIDALRGCDAWAFVMEEAEAGEI